MLNQIFREHPEYGSRLESLQRFRDLYVGGEQFKNNVDRYLVKRQREPGDVYGERLGRAFYENYIGSIIDWYTTTLFRREPVLQFEGATEPARKFYNELTEDCDLRGTAVTDYLRKQLTEAMVTGKSYTLVDCPRVDITPATRADEDRTGLSRAYLSEFDAESAVNWDRQPNGELDWIVFRTKRMCASPDASWKWETQWRYYDRQKFAVFRKVEGDKGDPEQIDGGKHALSDARIVPVVELCLPEGLWLMNRAAYLQLEHFNKSNALAWALTMGLFAMPVIFSDREWSRVVGESYYLQLGPEDKFGWTEPEGHVYEIALSNLDRLKEEIYRVCYVLHQAGGSLSKNSSLTGLSKLRDYTVTQEILRGYGDVAKDFLKKILRMVVLARKDTMRIDVSGLDEFDIGDFSSELADAQQLLSLGIQSATFKGQLFKKLALKFLCDVNQTVKDQVSREIEEQLSK